MVSVLGVTIMCIKFEFTDDMNFRLFIGECIYGRMYIHKDGQTDTAHILQIYVELAQARPNN